MNICSKFFIMLVFLAILRLSLSQDIQQIHPNSLQNHTLFYNESLIFQILGEENMRIGTFNVSVVPRDSQALFSLLLTRQSCSTPSSSETFDYENIVYSENITTVLFNANASAQNCIKVSIYTTRQAFFAKFHILVTFEPTDFLLELNHPLTFEISKYSKKSFNYIFSGHQAKIMLITIQQSSKLLNSVSETPSLEMMHNNGICMQSPSQVLLFKTWLCYFYESRDHTAFSLYNNGSLESFEIIIEVIMPKEIDSDINKELSSSIPGFGSLFVVNLPSAGVLKLKAESKHEKPLVITSSDTLYNLFSSLKYQTKYPGSLDPQKEGIALIRNKENKTDWYYFIPERPPNNFTIQSTFAKLEDLEVETEQVYYINPKIYEYKYIKLRFKTKQLMQKYQAILLSETADSEIGLYYNFDTSSPALPDKNFFCKQAVSSVNGESEVSLSFVAGSFDSTAYLTIYASKEGFYKLQVLNADYLNVVELMMIICGIFCCGGYLSICVIKAAEIRQVIQYNENFNRIRSQENGSADNIILNLRSNATIQIQIALDESSSNSNIAKVLEKLQLQRKVELLGDSTKAINQKCGDCTQVISENDMCDICFEAKKTIIFQPCGHICACTLCSLATIQISPRCPLCRGQVKEVHVIEYLQENSCI